MFKFQKDKNIFWHRMARNLVTVGSRWWKMSGNSAYCILHDPLI